MELKNKKIEKPEKLRAMKGIERGKNIKGKCYQITSRKERKNYGDTGTKGSCSSGIWLTAPAS